jgi:creatinine amidohydrolase
MPEVEWVRHKAAELKALGSKDAIVVLPIGSVEQHGPHLPTWVDTRLAGEVSLRAARIVAEREPILVLPTIWTGIAEHHMNFGGTITLDYPTMFALLRCVVRSVTRHGFRRVFILNGHGGNIQALSVAVDELTHELKIPIATGNYWQIGEQAVHNILEVQKNVMHACEGETSMMMALVPECVDSKNLAAAKGPWDKESLQPDGPGVHYWRAFNSRTATGVIGEAATASAEKGERLLTAYSNAVAKLLTSKSLWNRSN